MLMTSGQGRKKATRQNKCEKMMNKELELDEIRSFSREKHFKSDISDTLLTGKNLMPP